MFHGLIDGRLERVMSGVDENSVTEIRLRLGKPLILCYGTVKTYISTRAGKYIVTKEDIDRVLGIATDFSMYAVGDSLSKGFITKDGVRIGVCGQGVVEKGDVVTIKEVNSLVIRIPHQIMGCGDKVLKQVYNPVENTLKSTLIISPPGAGKTTLLRDMARQMSTKFNTLVIDERYELGSDLDLGECEIISGVPKVKAYEFGVRSASPELIVTDEIFRREEVEAVKDIVRTGVKIFASVHGKDFQSLKTKENFRDIEEIFEVFVTLAPIGKVVSVDYDG